MFQEAAEAVKVHQPTSASASSVNPRCLRESKFNETMRLVDDFSVRVKLMLGNMEELRDYHKHVMLPRMETAVDNAAVMRYESTLS